MHKLLVLTELKLTCTHMKDDTALGLEKEA